MNCCILCKEEKVQEFLDLGKTALANKFMTKEEMAGDEAIYPLPVGFCSDCGHVQLMEIVPPPVMFDHYLYISSLSETLVAHLHDLAAIVTKRFALGEDDLVVDIGSNDGTLLSGFRKLGARTLGVDPASNLAELAAKNGIETHAGFFGEQTARLLRDNHGPASIITSTNSFPHIQDLEDFMRGVEIMLADEGALVIEAHYLGDILEQLAFDTVYHEHVSYWALGPAKRLFERFGMEVVNAERLPIHHGQLRMTVCRAGVRETSPGVEEILAQERQNAMDKLETYQQFARHTLKLRDELMKTFNDLLSRGKTIVGYGAPAKGNTLLTFLGIGPEQLLYIADKSPLKQGRYTPGTHIPVVPAEKILEDQPDYVLLLAWNFADEILAQQNEYRARGGKFITPVPEVKII